MFYDNRSDGAVRLYRQCLVYVTLGFAVASFHEKNPCVGVEVGRVVRFGGHCFVAHLLGFVKVAVEFAEIISVVVQTRDIVFLPLQAAVVCRESLFGLAFLIEYVAHYGVEV